MDPDAAWIVMTNEQLPLDERGEAAMNILARLAFGGSLPQVGSPMDLKLLLVVDNCKIVLSQVLDAIVPVEAGMEEVRGW